MKKFLCALLAFLLALSFAACSKKGEAEDDLSNYLQDEEIVEKVKLENGDVFYLETVDTATLLITGYEGSYDLHALSIPQTLAGKRVIGIANRAFYYCNSLTSIEIPATILSIGDYAFAGCSFLQSVEIPASVRTLGVGCFYGCERLARLSFAENGELAEIPQACFWGCTALESVTIPSCVDVIGKGAFYGCANLTTLVVEESETPIEIRDQAFQNLAKLSSVSLPMNANFTPLSFAGTAWIVESN